MTKRLSLIFLGIILLTIINVSACNDDSHTILKISSTDNAHGEVYDGANNYPIRICSNDIFDQIPVGPSPHACNGQNKILGLSDTSNAHAQIPSLNTYSEDVCYGNLICTSRSGNCNSDETCVVTLSDSTNAHLAECGSPNAYSTKICCKKSDGSGPGGSNAYWTNIFGDKINQVSIVSGNYVKMVVNNTEFAQGTQVTFYIYELDDGSTGDDEDAIDDELRVGTNNITGTVDANGKVEAQLQITQQDISNGGNENPLEFYFVVFKDDSTSIYSPTLQVYPLGPGYCDMIDLCSAYTNEDECNQDPCGVAETSLEQREEGIVCGEHYTDVNGCDHWSVCRCKWNLAQGVCEADRQDNIDTSSCGQAGGIDSIGDCLYQEDTSNDDCSDGFLVYNWTATWTWDPENSFNPNPDGADYVQGNDGNWHYDPLRRSEACNPGGQTIPCPAQIKVPFFGILQLIIAILIIAIIYYYLINSKNKRPVKKSVRKKRPSRKESLKRNLSKRHKK